MREGCLVGPGRALHVGIHQSVPVGVCDLACRGATVQASGVHQGVEPAQFRHHGIEGGVHRLAVGDAAAVRAHPGRKIRVGAVPGASHPRAFGCEQAHRRVADAARSAGDDNALAIQSAHAGLLWS